MKKIINYHTNLNVQARQCIARKLRNLGGTVGKENMGFLFLEDRILLKLEKGRVKG